MHSIAVFLLASVLTFLCNTQHANAAACPAAVAGAGGAASATGKCPQYMIINARGTGEIRGMQSMAYRSVNSQILNKVNGGTVYNVNYAAGFAQMSAGGTSDIVNKITTTLASNPSMCFFLEGYSQGAAAVMFALPKLSAQFNSIRGISVVGNPLAGVQAMMGGAAEHTKYKCKTSEICAFADPVCLKPTGGGGAMSHVDYIFNPMDHSKIVNFAVKALTEGVAACGSVTRRSGNVTIDEVEARDDDEGPSTSEKRMLGNLPGIGSFLPGGNKGSSGGSGGSFLPKIPGIGSLPGIGSFIPGIGGSKTPPANC